MALRYNRGNPGHGWRLQCRIGSQKVRSHACHDHRNPCFHVRERSCLVAGPGQDPARTEAIPIGPRKRHGDTTGAGRSPTADAKRPAPRRAQGRRFSRTQTARSLGAYSEHLQELLSASCCHHRACPGDLVQEGKAVDLLRCLIEAHDGGHRTDHHGNRETPETCQPVEQGPCGAACCEQQHAHCHT